MLVTVEMASSGTTSVQRTTAAAPPVRTVAKKRTTAMSVLKRGEVFANGSIITAALILFPLGSSESNRFPIAAKPDRCGEEYRGECEADPQTGHAQKFSRSELGQGVNRTVSVEGESLRGETHQAVLQQGGEVR